MCRASKSRCGAAGSSWNTRRSLPCCIVPDAVAKSVITSLILCVFHMQLSIIDGETYNEASPHGPFDTIVELLRSDEVCRH